MFNKFTFKDDQHTKLWIVSDTHFCHDKPFIVEKRGFKNIQDHDNTIISKWNDLVSPQDNVIHLGDFLVGAGDQSFKKGQEILFKLNGHIHFIWGNHNAYVKDIYFSTLKELYPNATRVTELYPITYCGKITFYGQSILAQVKIDPTPRMCDKKTHLFFCSHFAHRIWIDSHDGEVVNLSGHSHGDDEESNPEFPYPKRLDCGIDNFGSPIHISEVIKIINKKHHKKIDHH